MIQVVKQNRTEQKRTATTEIELTAYCAVNIAEQVFENFVY